MRTSTSKSSAQRRTRAQVGAGAQRQPRRGEALADVLMTLYHWAARRVGRFLSLSSRFSGAGISRKPCRKEELWTMATSSVASAQNKLTQARS